MYGHENFIGMVAELAGISTVTPDGKASRSVDGTSKRRRRPKWIQTATREPIYSVLDSDETAPEGAKNLLAGGKVVVISAVKSDCEPRDEEKELSYVWSSPGNRVSSIQEVEDTLYSVVRKPKKVRLPAETFEEAIRPVDTARNGNTNEKAIEQQQQQLDLKDASRRVEVRKWLRDTPRQPLPDPPKMYSDRCEYENSWCPPRDRETPVAVPRGVVGLVGPYRVYRNPNEREYVLQEEELVEEPVDSTSEKVQEEKEENKDEHRQRAKWRRVREEDEDTLVPDIRDLERLEEDFASEEAENDERKSGKWRSMSEKSGCVEGILPGKEERAVDVPEAVSMTSTRNENKWGERVIGLPSGI